MKTASAKRGTLRSTRSQWPALALLLTLAACRPEIVDSEVVLDGTGGELTLSAGEAKTQEVVIKWGADGQARLYLSSALTDYEPPIAMTTKVRYSDGFQETMNSDGIELGFSRDFSCKGSCRHEARLLLTLSTPGTRAVRVGWSVRVRAQALKRDVKLSDVEVTIVDADGGVTP